MALMRRFEKPSVYHSMMHIETAASPVPDLSGLSVLALQRRKPAMLYPYHLCGSVPAHAHAGPWPGQARKDREIGNRRFGFERLRLQTPGAPSEVFIEYFHPQMMPTQHSTRLVRCLDGHSPITRPWYICLVTSNLTQLHLLAALPAPSSELPAGPSFDARIWPWPPLSNTQPGRSACWTVRLCRRRHAACIRLACGQL